MAKPNVENVYLWYCTSGRMAQKRYVLERGGKEGREGEMEGGRMGRHRVFTFSDINLRLSY